MLVYRHQLCTVFCLCLAFLLSFKAVVTAQPTPQEVVVRANDTSLYEPCDKMKACAMEATRFSTSSQFSKTMELLKEKAEVDPVHEFIVSFGRDTQGKIIVSPISTGNRTNAVVPAVENGFADLHNHPRKTPPSSGDVYTLLMKNRRNGNYTTRYILTGHVVYALVVIDTAAARSFLGAYPPQKTPGHSPLFPDELLNEYREIRQRYGAPEELAMAYLLEKYAAGVALLKQVNRGDFYAVRTTASGSGDAMVFAETVCR